MTLRDALLADTERRGIRRPGWSRAIRHHPETDGWQGQRQHERTWTSTGQTIRLRPSDVLAEDWEAAE